VPFRERDPFSDLIEGEIIRSRPEAVLLAAKEYGISAVEYGNFQFFKATRWGQKFRLHHARYLIPIADLRRLAPSPHHQRLTALSIGEAETGTNHR
jgi:hypothetical protein